MLAERDTLSSRRGFTLAEIILALVLGALVLGIVAAVGSQLQRRLSIQADRQSAREQLTSAAELLPIDLRGLSPNSGDIALGEARDSSIQLRATIASAFVCAKTATILVLAPYLGPGGRSVAMPMQAGDTAWLLTDHDTGEVWRSVPLRGARRVPGSCSPPLDTAGAKVFDVAHIWSADLADSIDATVGAIARVTRPMRFSFYRASDGHWYLGLRSWNSAALQFNTIQPVSGPFAPVFQDRGTRFQYFDDAGNRLSPTSGDIRQIARIEAVLFSENSSRSFGGARDSLVVVVAVRNRQ
jgi:prepilin-type N-terminal cleavage/methylation domain-containing protein